MYLVTATDNHSTFKGENYMGHGCKLSERFKVETPKVGDILQAESRYGIGPKYLICQDRQITACLSPGDQVLIFTGRGSGKAFRSKWLDGRERAKATFDMTDEDRFILDNGRIVPLSAIGAKNRITVLSLVPARHSEPKYDEAVVRDLVEGGVLEETFV